MDLRAISIAVLYLKSDLPAVLRTDPRTLSPSKNTGHFSLLSLSILISTCLRASSPSRRTSTSTGDEKEKKDAILSECVNGEEGVSW